MKKPNIRINCGANESINFLNTRSVGWLLEQGWIPIVLFFAEKPDLDLIDKIRETKNS